MNIAIKNVREEDWRVIKSEAVKNDLKIGEFLNKLLMEYKNKDKKSGNWKDILYGRKFLNSSDAAKIKEVTKIMRKEFEFR